MKVYRLERNEYGIFCSHGKDGKYNDIDLPFSDDALYSAFGYTCDRQYQEEDDYRSACESIEKLIEYFGSDFSFALSKGADIVEYNIHKAHVRFGLMPEEESIEVVFNSAKIISREVILQGAKGEDNNM